MQTMNTDQQTYYQNQTPQHQATSSYYVPTGLEPQYSIRSPATYNLTQRMPHPQYVNQQMANPYQQAFYFQQQQFLQNPSYVQATVPRAMTQPYLPIIRPSNETPNGQQSFIPQAAYSYQPTQTMYPPQQYSGYNTNFSSPPTQIHNQPQPQYSATNSQQPAQSTQTSQQSSLDQQHGQSSQSSQPKDKRQKKPLLIVDPVSHKTVEVGKPSATIEDSVTDSTIPDSKSQKQAEFRRKVAELLKTDNNANQSLIEEPLTKEDHIEDVQQSSTSSSRSGSISKQSSEQPQPGHPGIRTGSITEDKSNQDQNENELVSIESKSTPNEISPSESIENLQTIITTNEPETQSVTLEKTPSISKRRGYTIEELRQKQLSLLSQERPMTLKEIPGVTSPAVRQLAPIKPTIDGYKQYVRDVTAILNKLTPSNNDKLVTQLDELELNSAERLEGLITVMFTKAVEAAIFCSLYAKLCKHFQKKQVTVPNESGQPVTYFFRQILLTRCQKEFENEYRQTIKYEERRIVVDAIEDEKTRREAAEDLEEDLLKAKRKKLGNITFIGELFKLQMLTDTIMYDCIDYLLRDKTDEESLECLCKLLTNIGKELDIKANEVDVKTNEKATNRKKLEKNYNELYNISKEKQTSARIRFMIQDLFDMKRAGWVARRAETKPTTINEIHEQERIKREREDSDRDRDRQQQRREHNRTGGGGGGQQQYTESRGSRGSGVKQQSNRTDDDRYDNRVIVDNLRQYQSNEKRQLPLNLAPQRAWGKGSGVEKKSEDDRSNTGRTGGGSGGKPPANLNTQFRSKPGGSSPGYPTQRQPSRELARDNSQRDRENAMESLRKTASKTEASNLINNNSRESSRNVSPDPNTTERTLPLTTENNANTSFDEVKTQARVHSLIEEYTENYSDSNDRSVNEAIEDLSSFCTTNIDQQAVIVRELFTNVLEAKARARKAVGHLLDTALQKTVFSVEGFQRGIEKFIEVVPDYAVDIPLIWQYIGEILGAFIGAPSSNMILLPSILQSIPEPKIKQLFQDIIRYAVEFSSKNQIQKFWQSTGYSLNDLLKTDASFLNEYDWLNNPIEAEPTTITTTTTTTKDSPRADPQLVLLFKAINDQGATINDDQILLYIRENMNSKDKYYIRNIVLSYLEACLINREPQKKIQEDIAKQRMNVLITIMENRPEDEVQAVYAIQNFVHKLEHPSKMARLLFDIFYDEECVSEEAFLEWRKDSDQSETEGHSAVDMSTRDFFIWLEQTDPENEEEDEN